MQRGPLDVAIRASIAIPGMIAPYIDSGRVLADGGILDPLPVSPLAGTNADLTIAVSLGGADPEARNRRISAESRAGAEWLNRLMRSTSALFETNAARSVLGRFGALADSEVGGELITGDTDDEEGDDLATASMMAPKLGSFELMNRTIDVMQGALTRHQLAGYPPDILIEVPRTSSRSLDFHRASELIDVGRRLAIRTLDVYESDDEPGDPEDPEDPAPR